MPKKCFIDSLVPYRGLFLSFWVFFDADAKQTDSARHSYWCRSAMISQGLIFKKYMKKASQGKIWKTRDSYGPEISLMSGKKVSYILFDRAPYRELLHDLSIKSPRNVVRDLRGGINRLNPTACTCSSCGNYAPHKEHESLISREEKSETSSFWQKQEPLKFHLT